MLRKGIVISFVLIISVGLHNLQAQKKVKVERSDYFEGGRKDGKRYYKVVGDVLFIQGQTEIYCDSAYFYKKDNSLEAYGNIRIFDLSDSSEIFGDRLTYQGDNQFAKLRDNVIYFRDSITLYTDFLDYEPGDVQQGTGACSGWDFDCFSGYACLTRLTGPRILCIVSGYPRAEL